MPDVQMAKCILMRFNWSDFWFLLKRHICDEPLNECFDIFDRYYYCFARATIDFVFVNAQQKEMK